MDGHLGREVIFEWGGDEIPGVREKSIAINGEPVDVTADDNDGWRKLLTVAAENQVDITLSGVTKNAALKVDWFAGARTKAVTLEYPNGDVIAGEFYLANYSDTGPYNGAMTFEATLQSSGVVTYTPYS